MTLFKYTWTILQTGDLPLRPDGSINKAGEHRCTSALLWPEGETPSKKNTLITDPCILGQGVAEANRALADLGLSWQDVGRYFSTHPHWDHELQLPVKGDAPLPFRPVKEGPFARLTTFPLPGHHPFQKGLIFQADEGQVWIVGDAVLDEAWLRAWWYYWPNMYYPREVIQTWVSVGKILAKADVIVPGHGAPITVTPGLVEVLAAAFPEAEHADECPEVLKTLEGQLATFE